MHKKLPDPRLAIFSGCLSRSFWHGSPFMLVSHCFIPNVTVVAELQRRPAFLPPHLFHFITVGLVLTSAN